MSGLTSAFVVMLRDIRAAIRAYPQSLRQGFREMLAEEFEIMILVLAWLAWVLFLVTMLAGGKA